MKTTRKPSVPEPTPASPQKEKMTEITEPSAANQEKKKMMITDQPTMPASPNKKMEMEMEMEMEMIDDTDSNHSDIPTSKWPRLPIELFMSVINRIFSIPDILAFAAACIPFRSLLATSLSVFPLNSFSPLLLQPISCRLRSVVNPDRFHRPMLSSQTIDQTCLGCSHGYLISMIGDADHRLILLTNIFTGKEILSPVIPEIPYLWAPEYFAILTAPPSSPSCMFLWIVKTSIVCWHLASNDLQVMSGPSQVPITSIAVFKRKAYCIGKKFPAKLVEFNPYAGWQIMTIDTASTPRMAFRDHMYLVACGDELLLVHCIGNETTYILSEIVLYKLDFSNRSWVRLQCLGDWCLFIDFASGQPVACPNPRRWGGRDNCVYVAGPGCITWIVVPVDGTARINSVGKINMDRWTSWPCPIWVYPSMSFLN